MPVRGRKVTSSQSNPSVALGREINQTAHGFSVQDVVYYDDVAGVYALAQSDDQDTIGLLMVSSVRDADNFSVMQAGYITGLSGLTAGTYYYVSETVAGGLSTSQGNSYSNPILFAETSTTGYVLPFRANAVFNGGSQLDTTNFTHNLSSSDTTIQGAFDTLDNFTPAKVWATSKEYLIGDLVYESSALYRANVDHTSGASFAADSAKWDRATPDSVIDHTAITNIGTNTHAQIDTHIASTSNPHSVTASQVGNTTAQWNANQIQGITVDNTDIANGKVLQYNSTSGNLEYEASTASAGGNDTEVQYNSSGSLAGDTAFTFASGTGTVSSTILNATDSFQLNGTKTVWEATQAGDTFESFGFGPDSLRDYTTGGQGGNLAVGARALRNNTTGQFNMAVGTDAMLLSTTQSNSVAIGFEALRLGGNGLNVAIGDRAMRANTGNLSTAIGSLVLQAATSKGSNTVIGADCASSASYNAASSTFIGTRAGRFVTTGASNTLIGDSAGTKVTTGQLNVAIGAASLFTATTQNQNTAIGRSAMNLSTGNDVTTVGYNSLRNAGDDNTGIGSEAGRDITGVRNVVIGYHTARTQTSINDELWIHNSDSATPLIHGDFSTSALTINNAADLALLQNHPTGGTPLAIATVQYVDDAVAVEDNWDRSGTTLSPSTAGDDVEWDKFSYLDATTGGVKNLFIVSNPPSNSGSGNVGIGNDALLDVTTGNRNFGIGEQAARDVTTGSNNTAIGSLAMGNITDGTVSNNFALGRTALQLTGGNDNIGIGVATLRHGTGDYNIAIGTNALVSASLTGNSNVVIGYNSARDVTGGGNVILGYNAAQTQTAISNELWIDNSNTSTPLIWGDFSADEVKINGDLTVTADFNLESPTVPASASATGAAGDIAWDSSYIYVCTATNTWKRVAISTW